MAKVNQQSSAANGGKTLTDEEKKYQAHLKNAAIERDRQELNLQRANILAQRTSSPVRRSALESALQQIEGQLAQLG